MGNELWREITAAPLNTVVCAGLAGLFFYMWNSRVPLDGFATSYRKTVLERQYYRVLSSAIAHVNALHLVFNVAALWNVGVMMEASRGTAWYARQSVALLVLGQALFLWGAAATRRAIALGSLPPTWSNDRGAVGYSGVIFGWMTLAAQLQPHAVIPLPFGLPGIPLSFSPFVSLFVTQLLVPAASFGGHGAGIVAGFLISWGWVDAVLGDGYWFWCAATWLCGCAVLSLARADAGDLLPCLARAVVLSPAYSESSSSSGGGASAAGPRGVVGATAEAFRRAFVPTAAAAAAGAAGSRQAPRRRYMDAAGVLREDRGVDVESGQRGGSSSEESTSASSIPSVAALAAQLRGSLPRWWRGGGAAAPATAAAATAPSLSTGDNVIIPNVLRSGLSSSQRQPTAVPSSSSTSSNGGATSLSASAAATESTSSAPSSSLLQRLRGAVSAAASGASGARGGAYSRVPGAEATMEEEGARGRPDGVGHGAATTTTTSLSASASSTEAGGSRSTSNDAATARGRGGRGDDAQQQQPKPPVLIVNGGEAVKATTTTTAADSPGLGSSATAGRPTPHPSDWPGSGHESPGGGSTGPHI